MGERLIIRGHQSNRPSDTALRRFACSDTCRVLQDFHLFVSLVMVTVSILICFYNFYHSSFLEPGNNVLRVYFCKHHVSPKKINSLTT